MQNNSVLAILSYLVPNGWLYSSNGSRYTDRRYTFQSYMASATTSLYTFTLHIFWYVAFKFTWSALMDDLCFISLINCNHLCWFHSGRRIKVRRNETTLVVKHGSKMICYAVVTSPFSSLFVQSKWRSLEKIILRTLAKMNKSTSLRVKDS